MADLPPYRVSVALCTYNAGQYLQAQLDTLLEQNDVEIEVVVVDDGSTDGTYEHLLALAGDRFRVYRNDRTLGVSGNFEKAFRLCKGEFIAPCDQDDLWNPTKLRTLLAGLGTADLAYCDSEIVDEAGAPNGQKVSDLRRMVAGNDPLVFAMGNSVSGHALLFRRTLLEAALPIPADFPFYDWWLAAVAADRGGLVYLPQALVRYRQHAAAVSDLCGQKGRPGLRAIAAHQRQAAVLTHFAQRLGGPRKSLFIELAHYWQLRKDSWVCPRLSMLFWRHRNTIHGTEPLTARKRRKIAYSMFWGFRMKRLFRPDKYAPLTVRE